MRIITGLFITQIILISAGCSQTNEIAKGYAYARTIISGAKPQVSIAENGSTTQKIKEPGIQYFIYIQTKDTSFLPTQSIWIKGKNYSAETEAIDSLPVTLPKNHDVSKNYDTLIHIDNYKTWKINVGQIMMESSNSEIPKHKQSKAEVVVGYLNKGQMHYYSIPKITYLEPLRLQ